MGGNTIESINNSNSVAEKLRILRSTAQSRGLPSMAPVYRMPLVRKRFNYLSYYPEEKKPSSIFPGLNIERSTPRFPSNIERPPCKI